MICMVKAHIFGLMVDLIKAHSKMIRSMDTESLSRLTIAAIRVTSRMASNMGSVNLFLQVAKYAKENGTKAKE